MRGVRIGVPEEYFAEGLDPEIGESVRAAIEGLASAGCIIKPIKLPHTQYAVSATYYVLATAEASSNLARFDGVRFGLAGGSTRAPIPRCRCDPRGDGVRRRGQAPHHARHLTCLWPGITTPTTSRRSVSALSSGATSRHAFRDVDVIACAHVAGSSVPARRANVPDPLPCTYWPTFTHCPRVLARFPGDQLAPCADAARPIRPALPVGLAADGRAPPRKSGMFAVAAAYETVSPARPLTQPGD